MNHGVEYITDKEAWEAFFRDVGPHSFLQSWNWGETNRETGSQIFRIGIREEGCLVGVALLIKIAARRGSFILVPHGPIVASTGDEAGRTRALLKRIGEIGKEEHCAFVRVCPLAADTPENRALYGSMGFFGAPIHMHPELAWMLNIEKSEEELLREMRKTTRYLIRKLDAEGVEIVRSINPEDIELFWPVYEATAKRQHFTCFPKADLRKEFELFARENSVALFFGTYQGAIVAAAIIVFWDGQAFYHHSGSIPFDKAQGKSLTTGGSNVSYLLQWRVIQEAKRRGCTLYNFWGISPENAPHHPWAGLSQFKKGFGGFAEEYLHAQDKPLTWKYAVNYCVETFRRIKRGF